MTCEKCGSQKIIATIRFIGSPGYVAGSRKEYCGTCDKPPISEIRSPIETGRYTMVID